MIYTLEDRHYEQENCASLFFLLEKKGETKQETYYYHCMDIRCMDARREGPQTQ